MKFLTTLTFVLLVNVSLGQVLFNKVYSKSNFDYADAVIERYDGKYLIAGSSRSQFAANYDVNLLLVDSVGNLIWDKYIGQNPGMEFAYSLIETNDSNYAVVGRVDNGSAYLMKFDSSGTMIWEKEYISGSYNQGYSLGQTNDNNYFFITPYYIITSTTVSAIYFTDQDGDTLWTNSYDFALCRSLSQTADSGFIMTGSFNDPSGVNNEIALIKTNATGDTTWTRSFGGPGVDDAFCVKQLSDEGYIIAGNYDTQLIDDEWQTYIIRTNSLGDTIWTLNTYLGEAHYIEECKYQQGYILSTKREMSSWFPIPDEYNIIITKLDTLGNIQWSIPFDGYNYELGNNIAQTSDGGFLLTGYISTATAFADIILIKLDSLGNYVLSVPEIGNSKFSKVLVYPNPATDEVSFTLTSSLNQINHIKIFNYLGQEMDFVNDIYSNKFQYNVSNFSAGIYFYELSTFGDKVVAGKFLVGE